MNCKPNDLARVVSGYPQENLNRVIRVTHAFMNAAYGCWVWEYEGALAGWSGGRAASVADECLRPLDNPGDDEVDEMARLVGSPQRDGVNA